MSSQWVEVSGRRIRIFDDRKTQSVKVCTPDNEAGQYEQVFYFTGKLRVKPEDLTGCTDLASAVTMLRKRQYRQVSGDGESPAA